jgi:hypothetical protein
MMKTKTSDPIWSPLQGYIQVDSQVPGVSVYAPQPETED